MCVVCGGYNCRLKALFQAGVLFRERFFLSLQSNHYLTEGYGRCLQNPALHEDDDEDDEEEDGGGGSPEDTGDDATREEIHEEAGSEPGVVVDVELVFLGP